MTSTNSFGYQGPPSGGTNAGQATHGQTANNGFVSGILTSSALPAPSVNVTPFGATGTITQQLLPPSVVDDAAAQANQLPFPAHGPHDYHQWVDTPISQPLKQRINNQYGRPQLVSSGRSNNAQVPPPAQHPAPPPTSHPSNLPHPHTHPHLHVPQHQQSQQQQASHPHTQQHSHFVPQPYPTHSQPPHPYVTAPFNNHMPLTSPFEDGSSVQVSVNVQVQGQGSQQHSQPPSRFDLMGPASLPVRPNTPLPPQSHTAEAPQSQGGRYSRMNNTGSAAAPQLLKVNNVGTTMGMTTARAPAVQVQAPTKQPRIRQSRSRRKSQPPGTPCVPVHLRNPKKGRDRVFRKCQFCNHDNHIRRSKCDSCGRPLPAGKRRRDGSMHFEKLKREKLAATTPLASSSSSAALTTQTLPVQRKPASVVNDVVIDAPSSNSSVQPSEVTQATKVAVSNPLPGGVLPLPALASMPNANNVNVAGVLPLPAPTANPNSVNTPAAVHPHPSLLLHANRAEQSQPEEALPQSVPLPMPMPDNGAARHEQAGVQSGEHIEPSAMHPQAITRQTVELSAPVVVRLDQQVADTPHVQQLVASSSQTLVHQQVEPTLDAENQSASTCLVTQEQVAMTSQVGSPPCATAASQNDNALDVAPLRSSTHLDVTNNRPD